MFALQQFWDSCQSLGFFARNQPLLDPFVDQGVGSSDLQASSFVQLTGHLCTVKGVARNNMYIRILSKHPS